MVLCSRTNFAYAQPNIQLFSSNSESKKMDNRNQGTQVGAIMSMLDEAMLIIRDGKQISINNMIFGDFRKIEKYSSSNYGEEYSFDNNKISEADILINTVDDPQNYSDDRGRVALVPSSFTLRFYHPIAGITPAMIEKRLDLADYWVDPGGQRRPNHIDIRVPPNLSEHSYRYRANARADSRFPVDVEVFYVDPSPDAPQGEPPKLEQIDIRRAYSYLTPEMRKQKREEKEHRVHDLYSNPGATK